MLSIVFLLGCWGEERGSSLEEREEKKGNIFFFLTGFAACLAERPVRGQILRTSISLVHILTACQSPSRLERRGKRSQVGDAGGGG